MGLYATEYDLDQDERQDRSWLRDGSKVWVNPRMAAEHTVRTWSAATATAASSLADDVGTGS